MTYRNVDTRTLCIVSNDADVVLIDLCAFLSLDVEQLWVEFGAGQHRRWLAIHKHARLLGEETCRALLFWHALTGCDTVSHFAGHGKKTAWATWAIFPEVMKPL